MTTIDEMEARICRFGDALLWGWGEFKRMGLFDALLEASLMAIREDGTPRAPGTYSNPTLARILAAEGEEAATAMLVDGEIQRWHREPDTRLWADVAAHYYAGPCKLRNAEVARDLKVSPRTICEARRSMRRIVVATVQMSRETA